MDKNHTTHAANLRMNSKKCAFAWVLNGKIAFSRTISKSVYSLREKILMFGFIPLE